MLKQGYIQTYTGSGKNKTTASLGLAFRAIGRDWNILIVQFLKGDEANKYGEQQTCEKFKDQITLVQSHCAKKIVMEHNKTEEDREAVQVAWDQFVAELNKGKEKIIKSGEQGVSDRIEYAPYDLLIMDEILPTLCLGLITQKQFFSFVHEIRGSKPELEIVLTGRMWVDTIYDKIKDISDLLTDGRCVKHYFDKHCTVCKRSFEYRSNYCPNCGRALVTVPARKGIEF